MKEFISIDVVSSPFISMHLRNRKKPLSNLVPSIKEYPVTTSTSCFTLLLPLIYILGIKIFFFKNPKQTHRPATREHTQTRETTAKGRLRRGVGVGGHRGVAVGTRRESSSQEHAGTLRSAREWPPGLLDLDGGADDVNGSNSFCALGTTF